MRSLIFTAGLSLAAPALAQSNLFFSEFVEGSSNNKALELYNPTGSDVVLTGAYQIRMYFNGSNSPASGSTIMLDGTIPSCGVFVVADNNAAADVLAVTDQQGFGSFFNGDDAIELVYIDPATQVETLLDVIGQVGTDPGSQWGSGSASTQNNTIRRMGSISTGDRDGSDAFDPADEWDGFAQDTFDGLGFHDHVIYSDVPCSVTNNTSGAPAILTAKGSTVLTDNFLTLDISGLPTTGTTAYVFNALIPGNSPSIIATPGADGTPSAGDICIAGGVFGRHLFNGDIFVGDSGAFSINVDLTAVPHPETPFDYFQAVVAGETWFWQCWYRDLDTSVTPNTTSNFSSAISVTFQ